MPIFKHSLTGEIIQTAPNRADLFSQTGVANNGNFAVCDKTDYVKQIKFDPSGQSTNTTVTIKSGANTTDINLTLPATSGTLSESAFQTIQTPAGTSPVSSGPTDTLTFTSSDNSISITGNSTTDTIDFKMSGSTAGTLIFDRENSAIVTAATLDVRQGSYVTTSGGNAILYGFSKRTVMNSFTIPADYVYRAPTYLTVGSGLTITIESTGELIL